MKKKWCCLLLLLVISFAQNNEGYFFKSTINNFYTDIENIVESHFGPWDIFTNFSARSSQTLGGIDEQTGEITTITKWENVVANTRVDDKVKPNHDIQLMNGTSYTMLWNADGSLISQTPNDERSEDMLEVLDGNSIQAMFDTGNLFYAINGGDTIRHIGDMWIHQTGAVVDNFPGFDGFEGTKEEKVTYTFKEIKEKRGNKIAYIDMQMEIVLVGVGSTWEKTVEFTQSFSGGGKMQFNIDKGIFKKCKMDWTAVGQGRDLEDDSVRKYSINMSIITKQKLR